LEAEAYDGPALIIAYSHCIAHGINMTTAMQNQKAAVQSGQWLLYRYNPALAEKGENALHIDSSAPRTPVTEYLKLENRFRMLSKTKPEEAKRLFDLAQENIHRRWELYQKLAKNGAEGDRDGSPKPQPAMANPKPKAESTVPTESASHPSRQSEARQRSTADH